MKLQQKLRNLTSGRRSLQKRTLRFKQSLDEVNRLVNSIKPKRK